VSLSACSPSRGREEKERPAQPGLRTTRCNERGKSARNSYSTSLPFFCSDVHSKLYGVAPPLPSAFHARIASSAASPQSNDDGSGLAVEGPSTKTRKARFDSEMKPDEMALREGRGRRGRGGRGGGSVRGSEALAGAREADALVDELAQGRVEAVDVEEDDGCGGRERVGFEKVSARSRAGETRERATTHA